MERRSLALLMSPGDEAIESNGRDELYAAMQYRLGDSPTPDDVIDVISVLAEVLSSRKQIGVGTAQRSAVHIDVLASMGAKRH